LSIILPKFVKVIFLVIQILDRVYGLNSIHGMCTYDHEARILQDSFLCDNYGCF